MGRVLFFCIFGLGVGALMINIVMPVRAYSCIPGREQGVWVEFIGLWVVCHLALSAWIAFAGRSLRVIFGRNAEGRAYRTTLLILFQILCCGYVVSVTGMVITWVTAGR